MKNYRVRSCSKINKWKCIKKVHDTEKKIKRKREKKRLKRKGEETQHANNKIPDISYHNLKGTSCQNLASDRTAGSRVCLSFKASLYDTFQVHCSRKRLDGVLDLGHSTLSLFSGSLKSVYLCV